jgi:hypothetical protein
MRIKTAHILLSLSLVSVLSLHAQTVTNQSHFSQQNLAYLNSIGIDTNNITGLSTFTNKVGAVIFVEDIIYLKAQGYTDYDIEHCSYQKPVVNSQQVTLSPTPSDLTNAIISMDTFLGETNVAIPADIISMKPGELKFRLNGQDYDYSGSYTVVLQKPRQHKNPYFGLGSPDTANFVILEDFAGNALPLQNATIWEKKDGFIDVVALDKEWIYSGMYTIQN